LQKSTKMDANLRYSTLLDSLKARFSRENRSLEFKSNYQDPQKLGEYISALSNGACLDHVDFGYLFFGVEDKTLKVKGTQFDIHSQKKGNQDLELYLRQTISPKINFKIEEFTYTNGNRLVLFIIPAASGQPTEFLGKSYIRVDSSVTGLSPFIDWIKEIYNSTTDWTGEVVDGMGIKDLDEEAIELAKKGYTERHPSMASEIGKWDLETFLDKAKLTKNGQITRGTLLLIGKDYTAFEIKHIGQIVWKLQTATETAGEIFTVPFLVSTSKVLAKIRNYRFKIYPEDSLIPAEVWKYDTNTILEALHNCIAHQSYESNSRIIVTEKEDTLEFWNAGSFYQGSYEDYLLGTKTPDKYRNPFLATAMVNIKMIDTQGYGIHTMYEAQRLRYLPMPDYKVGMDSVSMTLYGNVIDKDYSLMLMSHSDLDLATVIQLDRVQKHLPITASAIKILRSKKLVEGRQPSIYIAKSISQVSGQEPDYTKAKYNDKFCTDLLIQALKDHGKLSRPKIDELLLEYLPKHLTEEQKFKKITNLLYKLRVGGFIKVGKGKLWELNDSSET